ncbi:hypothetical protein KW894_28285, partial [Klebsiella pneumoniae]|uniref:hypothetical protein n=1 Tax=Klebsiella pneumoniae TaxID=573 RepID=UPI001F05FCE2
VAGHGSCSCLCEAGVSSPSVNSIESIIECHINYSTDEKFTLSKAIRNDQSAKTVTPTVPYGSPLKGSVVELRRAWRGYEKGRL